MSRRTLLGGAVALVIVAVTAVVTTRATYIGSLFRRSAPSEPAAQFVGSERCGSCHTPQRDAWSRSHHKAAMAEASAQSVLGSFAGDSFDYAGVRSQFFKRDGKFFVRTDGSDGQLATFEIRYTFGVYPLQQYLIELSNGRIQALPIAWDARSRAEGGQRWFHLNANERVTSTDELHWTRPAQNWNYMCADCHSTAVRKNYDAAADRFKTQWAEISVGCEACHGPGSRHLAWAKNGAPSSDSTRGLTAKLDERRGVHWSVSAATGNAARSRPRTSDREIEMCAQCHSRRSQIADGYEAGKPLYDYYRPVLLESPLYYADGQQRGEVYEWGSFLQSKMYAHGVTCSDCHEPHDAGLRNNDRPGGVCSTCHLPAKYDASAHHHHPAAAGVTCVSCHMPTTTYMTVDARRDHSIRIPRPDLSARLGVPNACTGCHASRPATWAAERIASWHGGDTAASQRGYQRFADAFAAAERGAPIAQVLLRALATDSTQPAIARATAFSQLIVPADRGALMTIATGLDAPDPLLRLGALRPLLMLPPPRRAQLIAPRLSDSVRVIRIDAAGMHPGKAWVTNASQASALDRVAQEFVAAQQYNADRADARASLGTFLAIQGDISGAASELLSAIRSDPFFMPAYANLADVYRAQTRDADAEQILRRGLSLVPRNASLHYALGLTLVRLGRKTAALSELERAVTLAPTDLRFLYTYAVGLYSTGNVSASLKTLDKILAMDENNRDALAALASYLKEQGRPELAKRYADRLQSLQLQDPR